MYVSVFTSLPSACVVVSNQMQYFFTPNKITILSHSWPEVKYFVVRRLFPTFVQRVFGIVHFKAREKDTCNVVFFLDAQNFKVYDYRKGSLANALHLRRFLCEGVVVGKIAENGN